MSTIGGADFCQVPPYKYEALSGPSPIRLLKRLDQTIDGVPQFSLQAHSLSNPDLKYHCLSYTWGNPFAHGVPFREHFDSVNYDYSSAAGNASWPILIDGRLMRVHRNLYEALTQLPHNSFRDFLNRRTGEHGRAVVHGGAAVGLDAFLRLAASRGANMDALDDDGRTPLHRAAVKGNVSCVGALCEAGAVRSAVDKEGKTARELAAEEDHVDVVAALDRWTDELDPTPSRIGPETEGPEELLWVDAICINQADVEDRNSQVRAMDRIYSTAAYVVAWLGPEDGHTRNGIQALTTLMAHRTAFGKSSVVPYDGHDEKQYEEADMPVISSQQWDGLASIFQRQWFRRAWIVQEAVLPSVLLMYCGKHHISLDELETVAKHIRDVEGRLNSRKSSNYVPSTEPAVSVEWNVGMVTTWRDYLDTARRTDVDRQTQTRHRELFKLSNLIRSYWTFLASDVRDKVFAMNGLINVFAEEKLNADYKMSVARVFAAATRRIIGEDGDLKILLTRIAVVERRAGLPSWVPDFGFPVSNAIPSTFRADAGLEYREPSMDPIDSPTLRVKGIRLGRIAQHSTQTDRSPQRKQFLDPSWFKMTLALRGSDKGKEKQRILSDVLWRTLCMNMTRSDFANSGIGSNADPPDEFCVEFMIFIVLLLLAGGDQELLQAVGLPAGAEREPHTIIHGPRDAMKEYLSATLDDIDAISEHDGENTVMPRRQYVEEMWNTPVMTVLRTTNAPRNGEPIDYYPTPELQSGASKLVGKGFVNVSSRSFDRCRGFAVAYDTACGGRQLFTLDDKYLGLAPLTALVDDEVWIIPGLGAPAVLRRVAVARDASVANRLRDLSLQDGAVAQYEFIGGAYVHELMNGEVAQIWGTELQDIDLI